MNFVCHGNRGRSTFPRTASSSIWRVLHIWEVRVGCRSLILRQQALASTFSVWSVAHIFIFLRRVITKGFLQKIGQAANVSSIALPDSGRPSLVGGDCIAPKSYWVVLSPSQHTWCPSQTCAVRKTDRTPPVFLLSIIEKFSFQYVPLFCYKRLRTCSQ